VIGLALALLLAAAPAGGGLEVHGERDVFATAGVRLAWAVLRGPSEEATQVVIRLVLTGGPYAYYGLDGVDPFTGERRVMTPGGPAPANGVVEVRTARSTFATFPRREIHLYRTREAWNARAPALTIYYLGLPDTAPEFAAEPELDDYLIRAAGVPVR
jgi:hypothetical protein